MKNEARAFLPGKTSLPAHIGKCGRPIRRWRTLAADASLAASLGWAPAFPQSGPGVFLAGKNVKFTLPSHMASTRRHPLGVCLRQWLAAHSGRSAPRAHPGRSGARERTSPRTSLAIRSRCASACALPPRLNHSVLSESIARCQRFHPALCLSQMRCGLVKRGTPCRVKDEFELSPHFCMEGSGDGEASGATAEATGRRMADAGRGEVRTRRQDGTDWRGTQIARSAPPAIAPSRHRAARTRRRSVGLAKVSPPAFPAKKPLDRDRGKARAPT